jgi:hypothetical protein
MQTQPTIFNATANTVFKELYDLGPRREGLAQLIFYYFNHYDNDKVLFPECREINDEFKHMWT